MLNLNADLLYNNCLSHHFSEFQWTPALSGKLILGFQKHRKPECFILKICLGEHTPRSPLGSSSLRHSQGALRRQKNVASRAFSIMSATLKTCRKPCHTTFFISSKGCNFVSNSKANTFAYRPLVFGENDHRITHLFKNALQSEDFWKRWPLVYVWTDENAGFRIRWRNAPFTASMTHALQGMLSYFHCLAFSYGRAKTIRIRYVWTCIFFENGGKNLLLRSS